MQQFMAAKFEPAACAALLRDAIARYPFLEELFDPDSVAAGGCIASRALLYDLHQQRDRWTLALAPRHGEPIVLDTAAGDVPQLANAARRAAAQPLAAAVRAVRGSPPARLRTARGRRGAGMAGVRRPGHPAARTRVAADRLRHHPPVDGPDQPRDRRQRRPARSRSRAVQPGPADRRHARHAWPSRPLACPDDPAARRRRIGARHRAAHPGRIAAGAGRHAAVAA